MQVKSTPNHILILSSPYYKEVTDELIKGATQALDAAGASYEIFNVKGALEIPQALASSIASRLFETTVNKRPHFCGAIVLGCVIRGETSHYDIVAEQSAAGVMRLAICERIPIGNGILTVETIEQAMQRASTSEKNKGRDAAEACLSLIELGANFASIGEREIEDG